MKTYVCKKCGYIENNEIDKNYKCPKCGASFSDFNEVEDVLSE